MQHLGAGAGDLLRLVVVQLAQQARGGRGARVGAEHAGHVRPDLQSHGFQLCSEVRAGGVRAAASQQHGVARGIAGDEALRDDNRGERRKPGRQRRIGREIAGSRQPVAACAGAFAHRGEQPCACVPPLRVQTLRAQVARTDLGGHQFAVGHHQRARAIRDLARQVDALGDLAQFGEISVQLFAATHTQFVAQLQVTGLNGCKCCFVFSGQRGRQQPFQSIRDAADGRVHDQNARAFGLALARHRSDVGPIGQVRNARAAELQHDPGRVTARIHRGSLMGKVLRDGRQASRSS